MDAYSKKEIALMLENAEQWSESHFQELLHQFEKTDLKIDKKFDLVDSHIGWLTKVTIATFFMMLSILLGGALQLYWHR